MKGKPGHNWKTRKRGDWPLMTRVLYDVLLTLRDAKARDQPFMELHIHTATAQALIDRDWAFRSDGLDGIRWAITGRGERALKVYTPRLRRGDGLCPNCGLRPRQVYASGEEESYCDECNARTRTSIRRKYQKRRNRKAEKERRQTRRREMLLAGNPPKCTRPGCEKPARVGRAWIYDWCDEHYQAYMNDFNDRRRPESRAAQGRAS